MDHLNQSLESADQQSLELSAPGNLAQAHAFLKKDYLEVKGMSGSFAARVALGLLHAQSGLGITGGFAEIGVFEGRFFIAIALALGPLEYSVAVDTFDWPDEGIEARFKANVDRFASTANVRICRRGRDGDIAVDLKGPNGQRPRLIHLDGDHSIPALKRDLALAFIEIHPAGVILVDDMLHPGYPELYQAVAESLAAHPGWRVCCIIDREDIVAAAKFVICSSRLSAVYQAQLCKTFPEAIWGMPANFRQGSALVLASQHRLAEV